MDTISKYGIKICIKKRKWMLSYNHPYRFATFLNPAMYGN